MVLVKQYFKHLTDRELSTVKFYRYANVMNIINMPNKIFEGTIRYIKKLIAFMFLVSEVFLIEEQIKNRNIPDKIK